MFVKIFKKIKNKVLKKKTLEKTLFFTKDVFENKKYIIGDCTYGKPIVLFENAETNLTIGKYCSIADNVTIFLGGNHRLDWLSTYPFNVLKLKYPLAKNIIGHPETKGDVIIGNDVWIGNGVTILSGVTIGDGAVLAAKSVITKNVKPYEVWGGNPAKLMKNRFNKETTIKLLELKWWDWDEERVAGNVMHLCSNNVDNLK
jgi:acetyltransferase-like isoleucine patch superfamily enzyme